MYAQSATRRIAVAAALVTFLSGLVAAGIEPGLAARQALAVAPAVTGYDASPTVLPEIVISATRINPTSRS